jgi:large subunit ribosomal protein L21
MWNNLMRRWLEMATWWLPKDSDDATPPTDAAASAKPRPEPEPEPAPQPESVSPAAEPSPAPDLAGGGDDLTAIRGIGPAMQRRLEGLGIRSQAALAAADAKTLTEQLKADRAVVSQTQVAAWIEAAGG